MIKFTFYKIKYLDGEVYSWGDNKSSQVGNGDSITVLSPFLVSRFITTKVTRVACGSYHTLAVTENGEVYSWGFNNYGQVKLFSCIPSNFKCQRLNIIS